MTPPFVFSLTYYSDIPSKTQFRDIMLTMPLYPNRTRLATSICTDLRAQDAPVSESSYTCIQLLKQALSHDFLCRYTMDRRPVILKVKNYPVASAKADGSFNPSRASQDSPKPSDRWNKAARHKEKRTPC
jgi:hypothetical protein